MTISGLDGKPIINIDKSKLTKSRMKCMQAKNSQELLEAWANGEVDNDDAQTWLLFQMIVQLSALQVSQSGIPIIRH